MEPRQEIVVICSLCENIFFLSEPQANLVCTQWSGPGIEVVQLVPNYAIRNLKRNKTIVRAYIFVPYLLLISSLCRVKPKAVQLVFVASLLSTHH